MRELVKGFKMSVAVNIEVDEYSSKHSESYDEFREESYKDVKAGISLDFEIDECEAEITPEEVTECITMLAATVKDELHKQVKSQEYTKEANNDSKEKPEIKSGWFDIANIISETCSSKPNVTAKELCDDKVLKQYLHAMGVKMEVDDSEDDFEILNKVKPWGESLD